MGKSDHNWDLIKKGIFADSKTLWRNTDGQATTSPKTMLVLAGAVIFGVIGISAMTTSPHTNSDIVETLVEEPTDILANLTDFRALDASDIKMSTELSLTIKPGQSLGPLLQANGVAPDIAYATTKAFSLTHDPRHVRAGQTVNLFFDGEENTFSGLSMKTDLENTVFVNRTHDGNFKARKVTAEFEKELVRVKSEIKNSLYLDAGALGAPDKVIVQFAQIYAHSVDFQRDIQPGDAFELFFEVYRDHKGNTVKAGDLVFTSFSPRGKTANYYLYKSSDGRESYYDENGKGAKRMLMRTPVNGARLSSRYGNRRHPVLGYRRKHKGVDFAAPRGTPIMAAGTGTVVRSSRYGSFGNYVRIKHSDGYSTAYAHLSKFGRGIKSGRRVVQGQTIGYVGTTGRSTGPHLHYEVLKHGKQINPMTLSALSGKPLKKSEIPAFKVQAAKIDTLRDAAPDAMTSEPEIVAEIVTKPGHYVTAP
ncbi:MAG: M23 family metallopeptidase [Acidimicrobiales bacterium]|nr:M23 family metallopeptidase [Hyphomonadaceae bacterium]RZV43638.1 MAG: M23 family metallopeptidase [Acidimicrobiales bacterium]